MRRAVIVVFVFVLAFGCSKGPKQRAHEEMFKDYVAGVNKVVASMNGVHDRPTAEAAAKLMQEEAERMTKLGVELAAAGQPSTEEKDRCARQFSKVSQSAKQLGAAMTALSEKLAINNQLSNEAKNSVRQAVREFSEKAGQVTESFARILK